MKESFLNTIQELEMIEYLREKSQARWEDLPKLKLEIEEFRNSFPAEWRKKIRARFLRIEIKTLKQEIEKDIERADKIYEKYDWLADIAITLSGTAGKLNKLKRYKNELRFMYSNDKRIDRVAESAIQSARESREVYKLYCGEVFVTYKTWKARCPFHEERTPSFTIYKDGSFYCFGCGVGGNAVDFIMKLKKVTFIEAVKLINNL
mgnify:CR=1 FL=1